MPLSQEKSTNALTNDNTAIPKQWILSAQHFTEEMTIFKACIKCTLIVSLNVRWVSSCLLTRWDNVQRSIRLQLEKRYWCHNRGKKRENQSGFFCLNTGTRSPSWNVEEKYPSDHPLPKPFALTGMKQNVILVTNRSSVKIVMWHNYRMQLLSSHPLKDIGNAH